MSSSRRPARSNPATGSGAAGRSAGPRRGRRGRGRAALLGGSRDAAQSGTPARSRSCPRTRRSSPPRPGDGTGAGWCWRTTCRPECRGRPGPARPAPMSRESPSMSARGQPGVADRVLAGLRDECQLAAAAIPRVRASSRRRRSRPDPGSRRGASRPATPGSAGSNAGIGTPPRSIQQRRTGSPTRSCSGGALAIAAVTRRPSCSPSSTTATGWPRA